MKKRILISILLIPFLAFVTYVPSLHHALFSLFLMVLCVLASREIHALSGRVVSFRNKRTSYLWFMLPSLLLITAGFTIPFVHRDPGAILYLCIGMVPVLWMGSCVAYGIRRGIRLATLFMIGFMYCGVFPLLLLLLRRGEQGFLFICFLFLVAWMDDAAAYFVGTYFGKTRGIVKYSPNKSLEGYIGAFIVTMIVANAFKLILGDGFIPDLLQTNVLAVCIAVFAPLGDLGESVFKRKTGVKDSSHLLPGLGGVLDVFDSILVSVPVYYILVKIMI